MIDRVRYAVITPVRDEARYIRRTVTSMICQTVLPVQWIVVDDGSKDGTSEILDACAGRASWITVIHRKDRGHRAAGSGVMEAFHAGYAELRDRAFDFIVKLDGDLSFSSDYFERCFTHFAAEERLGIGGGTVSRALDGQADATGDPPFHVRGATKIYRRECWERIAPLMVAPGWDTIDEVKANLHGWTTRTFSDLKVVQHKPTGSADGNWRDWFKNGRANYVAGYHPLFMFAKCVRRAFLHTPPLAESSALLLGYCTGYLGGVPRVDDVEAIGYLRRHQLRRLLRRPSIYN
jgi:glycosyltransferase involved in cell wall biosynthesis